MSTVRLYGYNVASDVPLHQDRPGRGPADIRIRTGSPIAASSSPPPGRRVLHLATDKQLYTASARSDGSYVLRFYGTCDLEIDPNLADLTVRSVAGVAPDLAGVLAAGTGLAFLQTLRGDTVLHASAVQVADRGGAARDVAAPGGPATRGGAARDVAAPGGPATRGGATQGGAAHGGAAIAFVGASGMGKSTMATLLCADGARLITDDVLRLDVPEAAAPRCYLGATELRLRKAAGDLAGRFADRPSSRVTADERDALAMPAATADALPLAAIVVPMPDHSPDHSPEAGATRGADNGLDAHADDSTEPGRLPWRGRRHAEVFRLGPRDSIAALLRFPRLVGWEDPAFVDQQFRQAAAVAQAVPIYVARLPWGPPFPDGVAAEVLNAVGLGGRLGHGIGSAGGPPIAQPRIAASSTASR